MTAPVNNKLARSSFIILTIFLAFFQPAMVASAESRLEVKIPAGFDQIDGVPGVRLFRKDYPGGSPDFVQIIDLSSGAEVRLLSGEVTDLRSGKGAYGGNDARFRSKTVQAYYETYQSGSERLFCASNGSFFYMPEYPTRLPFPLKSNGQILTEGYAASQFDGKKLILELWPGHADIKPLSAETLSQSSAPDILGGLAEDANKRATHFTGRTFIGVEDSNSDGFNETILVFSSRTASQAHAAETLRSFGAQKIMMLDGGGSTQLVCNNKVLVASERLVPQALAVLAGSSSGQLLPAIGQAPLSTADLPASNLIAASPPPTSVPFNPDEDRPAVILPGAAGSGSSMINDIAPQAPPIDNPSAALVQPISERSSQAGETLLMADPSSQATAVLQASGQPLYDLSDILIIPMFMLPVVIIIFTILIRRQFERFSP